MLQRRKVNLDVNDSMTFGLNAPCIYTIIFGTYLPRLIFTGLQMTEIIYLYLNYSLLFMF